MKKKALLALLLFAAPAVAQSVIEIPPSQCVWRAGDNPAWAAPNLDESGWQPYAQWSPNPAEAHLWVRCHGDLRSLRGARHPAVQITLDDAYQLFVNGVCAGEAGNVRTGIASRNNIRQYPLPATALEAASSAITLRITLRFALSYQSNRFAIQAGEPEALNGERARKILAESAAPLANAVGFALIGVVGLMLLGLFHYDRSRRELLYLSINCMCLALLRGNEFCAAARLDYSDALFVAFYALGNLTLPLAWLLFFFALARRRVPLLYWLPIAILAMTFLLDLGATIPWFSPDRTFWLLGTLRAVNRRTLYDVIAQMCVVAAPFVAFWPYGKIAGRMRPLAVLCMLWGAADLTWFAAEMTANPRFGLPDLFASWRPDLLAMRALVTACVLVALLVLLFRDQRRTAEERAELAGEMQAASEIQRMLAPVKIDTAPGLKIDVAFHPMREVGGDFYLSRVLPDGRQRVLLGDVSGKGAAAAMAAALLLGAAAARDRDAPAELLAQLNRVLRESRVGGFATCLCADAAPDGTLTLANAGHLPPYRRGEEIRVAPGLPLGVAAETGYTETALELAPGETLTFLSDGVAEARSAAGELFGFERTREISSKPADEIAQAAQHFGQQDDITVLTLTFAPAEVLHA